MGVRKGLKFYVLVHIGIAIPWKLTTRNNAFFRYYSCRWYQD